MSPERPRTGRLLLFALLLAAAGGLKLVANPFAIGVLSGDGHYYYQVARHVAEGNGLLTSVSIFHQGLEPLPKETNVQPLWPLVLGLAGRWIGLERAASLLPELLYLVGLALLYPLANRMASVWGSPVIALPGLGPVLDVGHVAMWVLGTSPAYFRSTSLPHTEPLAFALLFATLLALNRTRGGRPLPWAVLAGVLAALTYLTRLSLFALPLAVATSVALAALQRPGHWRLCGAALGAAVLVCLPWWIFLASFMESFHPASLVHFSTYRETAALAAMEWMVPSETWLDLLLDRARGVGVAFEPLHGSSYARSFGASVYLVPLAALVVGARALRSRGRARGLLDGSRVTVHAAILTAACSLILTHAAHQRIANEWLFHWRPGLPMILLIVPALGYLLSRGGWLRAASLVLVVLSLVIGPLQLAPELSRHNPPPSVHQLALFDWIDTRRPPPTFVSAPARPLGVYTRGRFHSLYCHDSPEQTRAYFRELRVDYLIVYPRKRDCRFLSGLDAELERVRQFGPGDASIRVYRYSPAPTSAPAAAGTAPGGSPR